MPDTPPRALRAIAFVNVAVFAAWQLAALSEGGGEGPWSTWMARNFLVSSPGVLHGDVWTLLTSAFSHNFFPHLFLNLLALSVFGREVEQVIGPRRFVEVYVAGGVAASLGHVLYGLVTHTSVPALGASGSVMAIAVLAAYLFPGRMLLLFFLIPVPQFAAVAGFVLTDVLGVMSESDDLVAHAAHLGGALFGWAYWHVSLRPWLIERLEAQRRPRYGEVFRHPWS